MISSSRDGGLSTSVFVLLLYILYVYTPQEKATPLMCAAGGGHTDVVQVLLSRQDVDINMRDEVCPSQLKWTLTITQFHFTTYFVFAN